MKKFRDILETVYPPKSGDEKNFMDKHIVDKKDNPNAAPGQFTSDKKKAKRIADYDEGEEEKVYEAAELHTKRADKEAVVVRAVDPKTGQSKARVVNRGAGEIKIGEEVELDEERVMFSTDVSPDYTSKMAKDAIGAGLKVKVGSSGGASSIMLLGDKNAITKFLKARKFSQAEINSGMHSKADSDEMAPKLFGHAGVKEETNLDEKVVNPYAVGMAAAMKATGDKPPLKKSTIVKGHEIAKSIKKEAMDPVGKHDADIDNDGDTDKSDKYLIKRRKAIARAVNEAQIDELSKKTLGSYIGKASSQAASDAAKYGMDTGSEKGLKHFSKSYDRLNNIKKAAAKLAKEEVEQIAELSQDTLNSYHSKAGADRLKAKATVQKTMDMKKPAASTVDKATSAFSRFQKRGKGMSAAANKMSEETDLDEGHGVFLKGGSVGETRSGKPVEVHANVEDAKAQAKRLNKNLSPGEKKHYGLKYHVKPVAEESVIADQIDEAFKVGAMHLEDGSSITLTREDVDMLNNLFNQLNSSNKSKMEQRLKSSKNGFNEIITFAKEVV